MKEITVKHFWSIFIGVPWEKKFLQPFVSFRKKEERHNERKDNRSLITT